MSVIKTMTVSMAQTKNLKLVPKKSVLKPVDGNVPMNQNAWI